MMKQSNSRDGMSRRTLLSGALSVGAIGLAGAAGCAGSPDKTPKGASSSTSLGSRTAGGSGGPTEGSPSSPGGGAGAALPDYIPFAGVKADLPATKDGVAAGFLTYPAPTVKMHSSVPGTGGAVTSLTSYSGNLPEAKAKNPYWQEFDKRLGVEWKPANAPTDYTAKLATVLASGDLPDLVHLPLGQTPNLLDVVDHFFVDLAPYLAGDKIKDYPALANFPTACWSSAALNGVLPGIPQPRDVVGQIMLCRQDLREKHGADGPVRTTDDFVAVCQALTDAKHNKYALSVPASAWTFIQAAFGVPNSWEEADGTLRSAYEVDQIKDALSWFASLWKQGCFHPDSFAASDSAQNTWLYNGTVALRVDTPGGAINAYSAALVEGMKFEIIAPPAGGDGEPRQWLGNGIWNTLTGINKKSSPDRVRELLRVMDWLTSPFGTDEYEFKRWGIKDHDFKLVGGVPEKITKVSSIEMPVALKIADTVMVTFMPGHNDTTRAVYDYEKKMVPDGVADPTWGLYSGTATSSQASLDKQMWQTVADIAQGRKGVKDWDVAVADWRKKGGDKIRAEYEAALH